MVCKLIDFALVVLKLLMFKVRRIIGASKIELFNFTSSERVKTKLRFGGIQKLIKFSVLTS